MAQLAALDPVSIEGYLTFEEMLPNKHGLHRGSLYAMTGEAATMGTSLIPSAASAARH